MPVLAWRIELTLRPLFVLSMPRSGSTLVQRVLAAHDEIATAPEPWLLLPQVYATRETGAYAEYGQVPSSRAIREFAGQLPGGMDEYRRAVRRFAIDLYRRAAGRNVALFLDKTPRYHFIVDDLFEIFPDARALFLWRNPLAVAASIVETWGGGRWNLGRWHHDLFDGPAHLVAGYEGHATSAYAVRFEDLVSDPGATWPGLFAYLELDFDERLLSDFASVELTARMGDPHGTRRYGAISTEPLEKWKATFASPVRKRWARAYLDHIGDERLEVMGYPRASLLAELDALASDPGRLPSDLGRSATNWANRVGRERAAALLWRRGPR